jgi:ribonuclease P protein component
VVPRMSCGPRQNRTSQNRTSQNRTRERDEAHLPAEHPEACPEAWFPAPDVNPSRAGGAQSPSTPRSRTAVGLIGASPALQVGRWQWRRSGWTGDFAVADIRLERLRGRSAFAALRESRRRAHSGPVRVHYDPALPADESRRVAYSVPRRVGKATERNRCRRRLREVARGVVPHVPPGAYLIGVEPDVRGNG